MSINKQIGNSAFADGFVRSTLYFGLILLAPFVFDNDIPADGCGYIGFPMIFFKDCYWSGAQLDYFSLFFDLLVWLCTSLVIGFRWRKARKRIKVV